MIRSQLRPAFSNFLSFPILGACCFMIGTSSLKAGPESGGTVSIAEREIQSRGNVIQTQLGRIEEADKLLKAGNTAQALAIYEEAYNSIPDLPMAQEAKSYARQSYLNAGLIRAQELTNEADYPAATKILDTLDSATVAKGHPSISALRLRLADPDRYPPALTPAHIKNVEEVQRLLTLAGSQHETGMYDKALETYESVLRIDSTNSAARRGMEAVERERGRYFDAARDHQRSRMLNQVSELWEDKPKMKSADLTSLFGGSTVAPEATTSAKKGRDSIVAKLKEIKLERIDFTSAALEEVIEYLRLRSRDLDPSGKGVDFVLSLPADQPVPPVTLNLVNVPIEEVLRYVTEISGVNFRVEEFAVRIVSMSDTNQTLISKTYRVPPDFISTAAISSAPATGAADPFAAGNPATPATALVRRMGAKEFLESRGITFPEGGAASFNPVSNTLTVRTTANNIYLVDSLVEQSLNSSPKMAVIEVKIVEITNDKLDEVGFDWLLEGFGSKVEFAGGSVGNAQKNSFGFDEFTMNSALSKTAMGPITAGLRSSGDTNASRSIDQILYGSNNTESKRSPGILSLTGVLTDPQFQVVWRALDQKTGIDVVSKPSVITRSGNKASVEIIRELIYPTEFDPPQIPTNIGGNIVLFDADTGELLPQEIPPIPVTPTTPTAFETRRVGTILEVEPVIADDGRSVDLTITPELTEFDGFVNYGSPINTVGTNTNSNGDFISTEKVELTPNTILQPIFSSKKVATGVKVYDGATVVLGGLVTEQSTTIDDRVPLLGDLPVVGRLFQSKVKQRRTKNLILFVTVKVVDPSGNRINP
ncbi:MAG: hypothetical protein RL015_1875 [Verrucomicrobiota bacterium]